MHVHVRPLVRNGVHGGLRGLRGPCPMHNCPCMWISGCAEGGNTSKVLRELPLISSADKARPGAS